MKSPRKYIQGRRFGSFGEFTRHAVAGGYVWFRHKPYHGHVLISWPMRHVLSAVASGAFRYADVSADYSAWLATWSDESWKKVYAADRCCYLNDRAAIQRFVLP